MTDDLERILQSVIKRGDAPGYTADSEDAAALARAVLALNDALGYSHWRATQLRDAANAELLKALQ